MTATDFADKIMDKREGLLLAGVAATSFLATLFAFLPALGSGFLLDEQFLIAWSKALLKGTAYGGWGHFFAWSGLAAQDAFGPIASLSCVLLSQLSAAMVTIVTMIVHAACSVALYLVSRKLTSDIGELLSICTSVLAALIYSVHPLGGELINFMGAFGIQLSVLFFALSFNFYLSAHPVIKAGPDETSKRNSILAILFFICACLAYSKSWYLIKIVAIFEILNFALAPTRRAQYKALLKNADTNGRKRFFTTLGILFFASIALMFLEMAKGTEPVQSIVAMFPNGLRSMLLTVMFPINRILWKKYTTEYITLYVVFSSAAALSLYGLVRSSTYRVAVCTALAWVFFGLLTGGIHSLTADDFYGHRYLAHAEGGISILVALLCMGLASALHKWRTWATVPGIIVCLVFIIASCRHSFVQSQNYKGSSRLLAKIQKSALIVCAREKVPYCLAKDLPRQISFVPVISPFRPVVLDAAGLMMAPTVSGGPLKDALAAGRLSGSLTRWDATFDALAKVDLEPRKNEPAFQLNASQLANSLNPPLIFWQSVSMDKKLDCLKVASNSEHEPGIAFYSRLLSPLDGDAFYVDAKINAPVEPVNPNIELHWLTANAGRYEKEDRRAIERAKINDNVFHRYLLSLRGTGWTANGTIFQVMIGFPSSSSVEIKGIGIVKDEKLYAKLKPCGDGRIYDKDRFVDLCFNYPDDADLGLTHLDSARSRLELDYDVSAIAGSGKAVLFSSPSDQLSSLSASGELPNDCALKMDLHESKGKTAVDLSNFSRTGIYGLRVAALDAAGKPVGHFSDPIWLLVDRTP